MIHLFERVPSKLSTVMVAFDAGARAEGEKYSAGMAHMLEHMVFKGTPSRGYLDIPREVGFLGGDINAYTSLEQVVFYITVPYENLEAAMDILSDLVFNSNFPEEEFIKEVEVVKEEEKASKDDVHSVIYEAYSKNFFSGRVAVPVIGTPESINDFKLKDLKKFHSRHYKRSNAIVSLSSRHSKRDATKLLNKYFGKNTKKINYIDNFYDHVYGEARNVKVTRPQLEHSYVWMCYPGFNIYEGDEATEDIAMSIFGQGMDSRLFTEVREKRGLVYSIYAGTLAYRDCGGLNVMFSTRPENVDEAVEVVEKEIAKIKKELVSEEELERARNKYRSTSYAIAESGYALAKTNLSRTFYGLCSIDELDKRANQLSSEDIMAYTNQLFDDSKRMLLICESEDAHSGV